MVAQQQVPAESARTGIRRGAVGLVWGFGVQFAVGMLLNLFVTIPDRHPGAGGAEYFSASGSGLIWALSFGGGWALFVHTVIAVLLTVGCIVLFLRSLARAGRGWRWLTAVAALATLGALFNGLSFIDYAHDISSAIMAGAWLIAVGSLTLGLVRR